MTELRGSLYARLSNKSGEDNTSLDGWVTDMREVCDREGIREVALHIDDGRTGGRRDRDQFQAWLQDGRSGFANVLINPSTDRLTREGLNVAASILDVLEGKDPATGRVVHKPVRLLDTKGLDSSHGDAFRMQFVIQAEVGRSERERMRERNKDRTRRVKAAGRWPGGILPFGYSKEQVEYLSHDGKKRKGWILAVNPVEAKLLRECADRVLSGQTLSRVSRWLNEQGVQPLRADQFTASTVQHILTSDRPVGLPDGADAVFSISMRAALKAKLAPDPSKAYRGGRQPTRLLSGLMTCSGCGRIMVVARRSTYPTYRCKSRSAGYLCEHPVSTGCAQAEAYVTRRVLEIMGSRPMTRQEIVITGADALTEVSEEIAEVVSQIAVEATVERVQRLQELQRERDALQAAEQRTETRTVDLGITVAEWWEKATLDDQRDLIQDVFPIVELGPGKAGKTTFDTSRLTLRHGEPDHEYERWLQREG